MALQARPQPAADGIQGLAAPDWLEAHLSDPRVRVIEVDVSRAAHDEGHIAGAALWNIYTDLKDKNYRTLGSGALAELLGRSGVTADSTVVFYGPGAALGLWLLELHGHRDARVLDCSRAAWHGSGRPWSTEATSLEPVAYSLGAEQPSLRADSARVRRAIGDARVTLADVRSAPEFAGERFWPSGGMDPEGRAGHVPSAVHQPLDGLHREDGSLRPLPDLRAAFPAIDVEGRDEVITYCTIGGRAATAWFVLTHLLGRANVRVYDGSWAEWGRLPDAPVAPG